MTKQQPCATSLPPSRLCRLLIIAFALKLTVLGFLIAEPGLPDGLAGVPGLSRLFSGDSTASAATGAGASPPVQATLPDAGMERGGAGAPPSSLEPVSPAAPPAAPGISGSGGEDSPQEARALPSIGSRPGAPAEDGSGSGGVGSDAKSEQEMRDFLTRRQEDLARKEQDLRVLENELHARLERMQMLENRIASMIKDAEETKDAKFRHLVDVLSNMKSKQAAAVLETLDPKIAVRVLAGMRGRQAGDILTFVRPEIAAKLTEDLARMQLPMD